MILSVAQEYMVILSGFIGFYSAVYMWYVFEQYMWGPDKVPHQEVHQRPVDGILNIIEHRYTVQHMARNYQMPRHGTELYTLERTKRVLEDGLLDDLRKYITIETRYDEEYNQEIIIAKIDLALRR